nr:MAG TPA: hypothetical protein [Caudoviricetes sp.]
MIFDVLLKFFFHNCSPPYFLRSVEYIYTIHYQAQNVNGLLIIFSTFRRIFFLTLT